MKIGIIYEPIQWLTDTKYMVPVLIFIVLWFIEERIKKSKYFKEDHIENLNL